MGSMAGEEMHRIPIIDQPVIYMPEQINLQSHNLGTPMSICAHFNLIVMFKWCLKNWFIALIWVESYACKCSESISSKTTWVLPDIMPFLFTVHQQD